MTSIVPGDSRQRRANGENIPKGCSDYRILMYARIGRLGDQVERLLSIFRREQVKFIVYDDFVASTRNEYHETLDFLGVPDDGRVVFPIVNPNKRLRSRKLDALRRKIRPLWRAGSRLKRRLGFHGPLGLMPRVQRLLQSVEPRPRLASELRRELALEFRDDTGKLEGLIGRSLQSWASHPQSRD